MKRKNTYSAKQKDIKREQVVLDANGQILGRLATQAAQILRGKHKVTFSPYLDMGDQVTIYNAEKIKTTGNKKKQKVYFKHSGYPHGAKVFTLEKMQEKNPCEVIKIAIKGMLPTGRLGRQMIKKLKIFTGQRGK